MPVEIRELIIRAVTTGEPNQVESTIGVGTRETDAVLAREALIQDCVQQVLRVLKKTEER